MNPEVYTDKYEIDLQAETNRSHNKERIYFFKNSIWTRLCLNGSLKAPLIQDLQPIPRLYIDPDRARKVLANLIMNANEGIGNGGLVRVTTRQKDGWVLLSVSDNNCGMSKEFMERSLCYPFRNANKQRMEIGLADRGSAWGTG